MDPARLKEIWKQMSTPIENDDFSDLVAAESSAKKREMELLMNPRIGIPTDPTRARMRRAAMKEKGKGKQINLNPPPLYSDEVGEVDLSGACIVPFDGQAIRNQDESRYWGLFEFWYDCRRKAALRLFTHPGHHGMGGLGSHEGEELEDNEIFTNIAIRAIALFNSLRKDMKLKLVKLHKVNTRRRSGTLYYMTFDAVDEYSGYTSTYQAALNTRVGCEDVLGIFRDCCGDRTLAIMFVYGAERDLAAREKLVREIHEEAARYWAKGKHSEDYVYY